MDRSKIITYSAIVLMIMFLVIAFVTRDDITSKIMATLAIVTGAFTNHQFSKLKEQ